MRSVELVLSDIDGTIVPIRGEKPSPAVLDSINAVQDSGRKITAVTGRPLEMALPLIENANLHGLNIFDAGATIVNSESGKIEWRKWLDPKSLQEIAKILLPHSVEVDFFPEWSQVHPDQVTVKDITEAAPYGWAFIHKSAHQEVEKKLKLIDDISVHFGPGDEGNPGLQDVQITHEYADKMHAVAALRKIVHSDTCHTLAIGDSSNDLPLLAAARIKVAMGNASSTLKTAANHIVAPVEQDGFAEAMDRFVLLS